MAILDLLPAAEHEATLFCGHVRCAIQFVQQSQAPGGKQFHRSQLNLPGQCRCCKQERLRAVGLTTVSIDRAKHATGHGAGVC